MKLKFWCIGCGKKYSADVKFSGEPFKCKQCGIVNTVPDLSFRNEPVSENDVKEIKLIDFNEFSQQPVLGNKQKFEIRKRLPARKKQNILTTPWFLVSASIMLIIVLLIALTTNGFDKLETSKPADQPAANLVKLPEIDDISTDRVKETNENSPVKAENINNNLKIKESSRVEKLIPNPLHILTKLPSSFMVGFEERIELHAAGGVAPYYWLLSEGQLPAGLSFITNRIVGAPKENTVGDYFFTLRCIDSQGTKVDTVIVCKVVEMLMFDYQEFPAFVYVDDEIEYFFTATGGSKPYSIDFIESKLPSGLSYDPATYKLSGKPREIGEFYIKLRVTDSLGRTNDNALENFKITVAERDESDVVITDDDETDDDENIDDDDEEPEESFDTEFQQLMDKGAKQHENGDYKGAIATYLQALEISRNNPYAYYNIACAYALLKQKKEALEYLEMSVNAGFIDYVHISNDEDLKILRSSSKFKKIIKELKSRYDITDKALDKPLEELFPGYLIHKDEENKLIFLTNVGSNEEKSRKILDFVSAQLMSYAKAQRENYFSKQPSSYIKILLPDEKDFAVYRKQAGYTEIIGGWYNPVTQLLISKSLGHTLIHEFTHALQYADTWSRGIWHNMWFSEGMATCFESCKLPDSSQDYVQPIHNWRLELASKAVEENSKYYVKWSSLFKMDRTKFLGNQNIQFHYAQVRYIVYWLYEIGKLKEFYNVYNETYKKDKTGIKAFEKVFGKTLNKIEDEWLGWMKKVNRPVRSAWLGVSASYKTNPQGVKLTKIQKNSPAKDAKLKRGDILLRVGSIPLDTLTNLAYAMTVYDPGDEIEIAFIRREEVHIVKVKLIYRENNKGY